MKRKKSKKNVHNHNNENRRKNSSRRKSIFDIDIEDMDDFKNNNDESMVEFIQQKFHSVSKNNSSNMLS